MEGSARISKCAWQTHSIGVASLRFPFNLLFKLLWGDRQEQATACPGSSGGTLHAPSSSSTTCRPGPYFVVELRGASFLVHFLPWLVVLDVKQSHSVSYSRCCPRLKLFRAIRCRRALSMT